MEWGLSLSVRESYWADDVLVTDLWWWLTSHYWNFSSAWNGGFWHVKYIPTELSGKKGVVKCPNCLSRMQNAKLIPGLVTHSLLKCGQNREGNWGQDATEASCSGWGRWAGGVNDSFQVLVCEMERERGGCWEGLGVVRLLSSCFKCGRGLI